MNESIVTGVGIVIWDGVTRPETKNDGAVVHSLKIALSVADGQNVSRIAQTALNECPNFKGVLPQGAFNAVSPVKPGEIDPAVQGMLVINAKTWIGAPNVHDISGKQLTPIEYGSSLYPGAKVRVLVYARTYNNVSKGVGLTLQGVQIVDAKAPKLSIAQGTDTVAAFANAPLHGQVVTAPAPAQTPPPPAMDFVEGPASPPPPAPVEVITPGAPGHQMAKAATTSYAAYISAGWTDAQLIAKSLMVALDDIPF